jgi:hypothetical protein
MGFRPVRSAISLVTLPQSVVERKPITAIVIGKANGTVVDTGADAQRYCELLVEGSFHDNVEARSAGACEGMIETAMFFSPACQLMCEHALRGKAAFWKVPGLCCGTSIRIRID